MLNAAVSVSVILPKKTYYLCVPASFYNQNKSFDGPIVESSSQKNDKKRWLEYDVGAAF